ncbi:GntR family transcriptional regulator [Nocardia mexicana]|uniref:GntR family transcriptional regulator n=1 Tax=Nocardia mexicana TaxID=279262 RepID=A0A370HC04_9NOCA|nr:GntR family transcriptional regulator [Nocardia mexicana]RDI53895.1 GntR family transcriptional regulator [Nocardia mexicana]
MPEIEEVLPKYLQIAGYLRDQIVRGDLPPGAEVPSERELAAAWNVARPTATKALQALRQQGLVESRRGSGTYVREPNAAPRTRERIERAAKMGTMYSNAERVEFPFVGMVDAPEHVASSLGIASGSLVVQRRRIIRSEHTGPIELSTSWFPSALADSAPRVLVAERIRGGTLPYIAEAAGRRVAYARDQVCARQAADDERAALDLPDLSPVLVYWLVAYDSRDTPIQFDEAIYPPKRWAFRQEYPITI